MVTPMEYAHANRERFLSQWQELVRIPSVGTDPNHKGDTQALFVAESGAQLARVRGDEGVEILGPGQDLGPGLFRAIGAERICLARPSQRR